MVYTPSALNLTGASQSDPHHAPAIAERTQTFTTLFQCDDGRVGDARHRLPSSPLLEAAFTAFARGTLIATTRGPVAVEDLHPGMNIITNERGPSPLLWIGSTMLRPGDAPDAPPRLIRIMTGALGIARPMVDLMTGPGARIAQRASGRAGQVLRPVHNLIDGNHIIALRPPGAVEMYHIALRRHATITAAGLALETYHPGPGFDAALSHQQLAAFVALFPHIRRPADFASLAHPRGPLGPGRRAVA